MKANAIICEYNPFHNGHKYQIEQIKKRNNNPIIAIMSGSFTQRGDIAVENKFSRTKNCLTQGVDLVVELPVVYSTANAEVFASRGVEIADALGCVENLCFGAECDNHEDLQIIAEAFTKNDFIHLIKEYMSTGTYYPKAVEMATEKIFSKEIADVIKEPNNVLGIEYLKALSKTNISPLVIKRKAVGHNEDKCVGNITNASTIRKMISENNEKFADYIPIVTEDCNYAQIKKLEKIILYKLRTMKAENFAVLPDVTEGLENRIYDAVMKYNSVNEILEAVKTKRYTMARIRRIIIHALLGITKKHQSTPVPYLRVLGFNNMGRNLLTEIKSNCKLPLITNVAGKYTDLPPQGKEIFDKDILATDLHSLGTDNIKKCGTDFTNGLIIIN